MNHYEHLHGLDLADSVDVGDTLEIDLLIGSYVYWSLATRKVIREGVVRLPYRPELDRFYWVLSINQKRQSISHSKN